MNPEADILAIARDLALPAKDVRTAGIYFLFKDSELIYIGQSGGCQVRINQHLMQTLIDFDAYTILPVQGSRAYRGQVERALIEYFQPTYNLCTEEERSRRNGLRLAA